MIVRELISALMDMPLDADVGAVVAYAREGEFDTHPITVCLVERVEEEGSVVVLHTGAELP